MKAKFLTLLKYLFFLVLGGFFVWLSVRNLDHENWVQIKDAVARGRKWVIFPVILFFIDSALQPGSSLEIADGADGLPRPRSGCGPRDDRFHVRSGTGRRPGSEVL